MYRVLVVEDEADEAATIKSHLERFGSARGVDFSVTWLKTAFDLISQSGKYDLVFLDIDLPGINGMEAAQLLRIYDEVTPIIFVTNLAQYAVKGYEVDALDYIVKPVDKYAFALKMQRALDRVARRKDADILLKTADGAECLQVSHIKYLEVQGHYVIYHTYFGNYSVYSTLSAEEKRLPARQFVKCNRNLFVNLRYIESVGDGMCVLAGEELPISRPQKKAFVQALQNYMHGGGNGNV